MMVGASPMTERASLRDSEGTIASKLPSRFEVSTWVSHTARRYESVATRRIVLFSTVIRTPVRTPRLRSFDATRHTRDTISESTLTGRSTHDSMA